MLEVLAGPDGYDPRQHARRRCQNYTEALEGGVKGMKIAHRQGRLRLAAIGAGSRRAESVRDAAKHLASLGAESRKSRCPCISSAPAMWLPIGTEGVTRQDYDEGDGYGLSHSGLFAPR